MRRRIAFIDYFAPHYRKRLYEEISRRMDADFFFFSDENERWHNKALPAIEGGDYRRVDLWKTRIAGQSVMPGLARELSPRRYDAVVKSLNGKLMLPLTYGTAKARGVPFVLWSGMWHHPESPAHRLSRRLTEGIYRGADAIVAYGEHVKDFIAPTPGVDPRKIYVAGQAVDPARFEEVEPERGSADVLFVGQFKPYKGIRYLLEAFERLGDTEARLRMVGNGPLEDEIRSRVNGDSRVQVLGTLSQSQLPGELARARCLVLPSVTTALDREPWGLVVNEAMHSGIPVVASDAVGAAAAGLVRDGENGLVVPERDGAALAEAIRRLVTDPELAARLGEKAREDVKKFDYRRMADAFEAAVEHAVAARSAR